MPKRERIEWCDIRVHDADRDGLPRALFIGDSITMGYFSLVEEQLKQQYACGRIATSKCVCDPSFTKELGLVMQAYAFDVVHFNNGLHGWDYDDAAYGSALPDVWAYIKEHAPHARLIWAASTPIWRTDVPDEFDPRTDRVRERNRIAHVCAAELGIAVNDLFGLIAARRDLVSDDGVHLRDEGRAILAKQVVNAVLTVGRPEKPDPHD